MLCVFMVFSVTQPCHPHLRNILREATPIFVEVNLEVAAKDSTFYLDGLELLCMTASTQALAQF